MLQIFLFRFKKPAASYWQRHVGFNVVLYAKLHDIDLFSRRQKSPEGWQF